MTRVPESLSQHIVISNDRLAHHALPVDSLDAWSQDQGAEASRRLIVETPAEAIVDAWSAFRALRPAIAEGGRLSVHSSRAHGHGLHARYLDILLRLSGFMPESWQRSSLGYWVDAEKCHVVARDLTCSVIVPCRNEEDNVEPLLHRLPSIGSQTELIFVDGASTDSTVDRVQHLVDRHPERNIRLLHQREAGGKARAVFQGFNEANGDVLMILDADMTVAPEDLPRFFLALAEGVAEFANGTRFAYAMERGAMQPLNNIGNRAFSSFFSWLLGTRVTDTLCGTKALFRRDWISIDQVRPMFGGHDPWGDFDLLLGAGHLGLRTVDVPVRYAARVAGESKMRPLRHGAVLAKTTAVGVRRLKIEPRIGHRTSG